jgi:Domain of unknown function (DUF5655)
MVGLPYRGDADREAADRFWAGRPLARARFERLAQHVLQWGACRVVATGTRVGLTPGMRAGTRFLWCPVATADGRIAVRFILPRLIESPRLRADELSGRWSHRVSIEAHDAFDGQLLGWLRESYQWAAQSPQSP